MPAIVRDLILMVGQPSGPWRFVLLGLDSAGRVLEYTDRRSIPRRTAVNPLGQAADSLMTDIQLMYMTGEGRVANTLWHAPREVAITDVTTLGRATRYGHPEENIAIVRARCGP